MLSSDSLDDGTRILHCRAPDIRVIESPTTIPEPDNSETPVFPEVPPSMIRRVIYVIWYVYILKKCY